MTIHPLSIIRQTVSGEKIYALSTGNMPLGGLPRYSVAGNNGCSYMTLTANHGCKAMNEPSCKKKKSLHGFRSDLTQIGLYSQRSRLDAGNFGYKKKRDCTISISVAKTKALISCAVTAQLICVFIFAYVKKQFSHYVVQIKQTLPAVISPCAD